MMGGIVTWNM